MLPADGYAVINNDDPSHAAPQLAAATKAKVILYGLSEASNLRAKIERIDSAGTCFTMTHEGKTVTVRTPLIGRHNVYNCLAAAGACIGLGISMEKIASVLANVKVVPGRLERVQAAAPFEVFVDYAHTDDALQNVLTALRPVAKGRLILVFGCGGDRDPFKRPRMAKVAQELADVIFATSDNPRGEKPESILDQIKGGFSADGLAKTTFEVDRRKAIGSAIAAAGAGDMVLIAGKGHEKYQIIAGVRSHFDDVEEAAAAIRGRGVA
jgi:UDP-N-acetylmuramoyl-L-alanyl-D-glutamate--2,6-diaminopimelate ligase